VTISFIYSLNSSLSSLKQNNGQGGFEMAIHGEFTGELWHKILNEQFGAVASRGIATVEADEISNVIIVVVHGEV
jgi:hypothetical protein